MKHLLHGRAVSVAVISGAAVTLAVGAFGLGGGAGDDPAPIRLETGSVAEVTPVPLESVPASTQPTIVSPAEPEVTEASGTTDDGADAADTAVASAPSPVSAVSQASPVSAASPASADSPDEAVTTNTAPSDPPAPAADSPASAASADSPASAASAGSIDS